MNFSIETINEYKGPGIKAALFDFDGTISLIREGWQQVMIPYFCEVLNKYDGEAKARQTESEVKEFVDRLTGKQTIFQCIALDEAVIKRGGGHKDALEYKKEYLRRLNLKIQKRKQGLASGEIKKESYTVKGATEFIQRLRQAGVKCFLASGTDEQDVIYEASLLGFKNAFDGGIYGAKDGLLDCSKETLINELIKSQGLSSCELVAFGDGFVEIELTSTLGGFAVGVATNEKTGEGIDGRKRKRLINAGADLIIPSFENTEALLNALKL